MRRRNMKQSENRITKHRQEENVNELVQVLENRLFNEFPMQNPTYCVMWIFMVHGRLSDQIFRKISNLYTQITFKVQ